MPRHREITEAETENMLRTALSRRGGFPPINRIVISSPLTFSNDEKHRSSHAGFQSRSLSTTALAGQIKAASLIFSPAEVVVAAKAAPLVGPGMVSFLSVAPPLWCQLFWLAPMPTVKEMQKNNSTGGLPPLGYFSMMANGWLWACYGVTAGERFCMSPTSMSR